MLSVLSYFIRCSTVLESMQECPTEFSTRGHDGALGPGEGAPDNEEGQGVSDPAGRDSGVCEQEMAPREMVDSLTEEPATDAAFSSDSQGSTLHGHSLPEGTMVGSVSSAELPDDGAMVTSGSTVTSSRSDRTIGDDVGEISERVTSEQTGKSELQEQDTSPGSQDSLRLPEAENEVERKCRLSDSSVEESPKVASVTHVGRALVVESSPVEGLGILTAKGSNYSDDQTQDSVADTGLERLTVAVDTREESAHDSGVFDQQREKQEEEVVVSETDSVATETDSGAVSLDTQSSPAKVTPGDVQHMFTRNMSVFDEYFKDGSTTPTDLPNLSLRRTEKMAEHEDYKRLASIEGSQSVIDEYIQEPLPDFQPVAMEALPESPHVAMESLLESPRVAMDVAMDTERISPKEGYFGVESAGFSATALEGGATAQVQSALRLMQQSSREEALMLSSGEFTSSR